MSRVYILECGDWYERPSEEQREMMLAYQDEQREFRARSRPLREFLKKSVWYNRIINLAWRDELKQLMCRRVEMPEDSTYVEIINTLLENGLRGYAGIMEIASKMDNTQEYQEGFICNALRKRLGSWFGNDEEKYYPIEEPEMDSDPVKGSFFNTTTAKDFEYDEPQIVIIKNRTFCFTGKFKFGSRKKCAEVLVLNGGFWHSGMSAAVDYLVVASDGENASPYSTKVESFNRLRFKGHTAQIITEEKWRLFLQK